MFDFLREIKDNVAAEASLVFGSSSHTSHDEWLAHQASEDRFRELNVSNRPWLEAIDPNCDTLRCSRIYHMINENGLKDMPIEDIAKRIGYDVGDIEESIAIYLVLKFLRDTTNCTLEQVRRISEIARVFETNVDKSADEIVALADCTVDELSAVIKLLDEYKQWTRQQKILCAIIHHTDFKKRNPVDIGIECGYSEEEVIELLRSLEQETKENE